MKNLTVLTLLLFIAGCNANNSSSLNESNCGEPHLRPFNYGQGANAYFHAVMLDNYNEACFNNYDFINIADKYLDSVSTNLPVQAITFVKPFDFQPYNDMRDNELIRGYSIVEINYDVDSIKNRVPEITSISIWTNGKRKSLEYMDMTQRKHKIDYYNSKKK